MRGIGPPETHIWLMFAGTLLLLWAAFRLWDEQRTLTLTLLLAVRWSYGGDWQRELETTSLPFLSRDKIAELRVQLARQRGRHLTSEQRLALVTALSESDDPIRVKVVYNHLDAEAEAYAWEISAILLPLRFAGAPMPVSDEMEGVVIRVNSSPTPPLAQRLSNALTRAKIDHRIEQFTGERASSESRYFDLEIGRMNQEED